MAKMSLKTFFLYLFVCSIVLSALMGIWAIISGEFGELQGRILATTSTVVGTSILGLACGAYFEKPRSRRFPAIVVPLLGIALSLLSALIILYVIWVDDTWDEGAIYRILAASIIFAFSFAQLSLLSIARLSRRFKWSIASAYLVILTLASITSVIVLFELSSDGEFVLRLIGVLTVIDASLTVMIPIFHRLSRGEFSDTAPVTTEGIDAEIAELRSQIARLERQKDDILNAQSAE